MLKNPFQIAITFALLALITKLTFFYLEIQHGEYSSYITHIYMLISLIAVFFGIRSEKINNGGNPTSFRQDLKAGARTAAFFAILVSGITYVYYAKIDSNFFTIKKEAFMEEYKKEIPKMVEANGKEQTKESIKGKILNLDAIYTPYSQSTYTLFGLVFLGLINSITFALLMKKFPGFKQ